MERRNKEGLIEKAGRTTGEGLESAGRSTGETIEKGSRKAQRGVNKAKSSLKKEDDNC